MEGTFLHPKLECDLVMKGGITSGVVYPPAIITLADTYRFRSIGGTSAGAMAAAITAAAEYGREQGGMQKLGALNNQLNLENFVRDLIQPSSNTRPLREMLFDLATAFKQTQRWRYPRLAMHLSRSALKHTPGPFVTGAVTGAGLSAVYTLLTGGSLAGPGLITPLLFGWLGGVAGSAYKLSRDLLNYIPKNNFYGLCNGHDTVPSSIAPPLTDWLHNSIQHLANLDNDDPLTFERLVMKLHPAYPDTQASEQNPTIDLRMVTSNLSQGRPYMLPFDTSNFLFNVQEMERLFPQAVVTFMKNANYTNKNVSPPEGYYWLPSGNKLPVVVAARLSLSFPLLISAVPLYTIKRSAFQRKKPEVLLELTADDLQQNWFSDGGISSNFPIHFFDAWFPTRPTFGISLVSRAEDTQHISKSAASTDFQSVIDVENAQFDRLDLNLANNLAKESTHLPRANDPPTPDWRPIRGLSDFGMAIFSVAQNYRDTMQSILPSYRERVVQIIFDPDEGGLNLEMDPKTIDAIQQKGREAALKLVDEFNMEHHQWVRLVVLLSLIEDQLHKMEVALSSERSDTSSFDYETLFKHQLSSEQPFPYRRDERWCRQARARIEALRQFIDQFNQEAPADNDQSQPEHSSDISQPELLSTTEKPKRERQPDKTPRPKPVLRVTPEL
ncbi:MAG: RpoH suppressor SuhR [Roseiflexaceae bacterium]